MEINYIDINIGINLTYIIWKDFINWQPSRKMIKKYEKAIYRSTNPDRQQTYKKMLEFTIVEEMQMKVIIRHHVMISQSKLKTTTKYVTGGNVNFTAFGERNLALSINI